jgi:hypothetical protein
VKRLPPPALLLVSLILASCNLGAPAPQDQTAAATSAALTVEAVLSPAASPTAQAQAAPTETPIPGVAIDGTTAEAATCEDQGSILSWKRDGVEFNKAEADKPLPPGKRFTISLEFKNTGTCIWTHQYRIFLDSGEPLTIENPMATMQTGFQVKPGESITLNMQFTAPSAPGSYESTYRLDNEKGQRVMFFGIPTRVGTPSTGSLPAPGDLRYEYSCSPGVVTIGLTWKDRSDGEEGFRIYRDGTKLTDLPSGSTSYEDVLSAPGSYAYAVAAFNTSGESPANVTAQTTNCQ